jgi:hypothetical protein
MNVYKPLLAFCAAFFVLLSPLAAVNFVPTSNVPSDRAQFPIVQVDAQGNSIAIWLETTSEDTEPASIKGAILPAGQTVWKATNQLSEKFALETQGSTNNRVQGAYRLAVDPAGNAVAIFIEAQTLDTTAPGFIKSTTLAAGSTQWSKPILVDPNTSSIKRDLDLGIDAQGNAIAIWQEETDNTGLNSRVKSAQLAFNGSGWTNQTVLTTKSFGEIHLAVNQSGEAVATWTTAATKGSLSSATLTAGSTTWSSPEVIAPIFDVSTSDLAIDPQGYAIAVFKNAKGLIQYATKQIGSSWVVNKALSTSTQAINPLVSINELGDAVVVWGVESDTDFVGGVQAISIPFEGSPSPIKTLAAGNAGLSPVVQIDAAGNAIAVFSNFNGTQSFLRYAQRSFSGIWAAPKALTAPLASTFPLSADLDINASGYATLVYSYDGTVRAAISRVGTVNQGVKIRLRKNEFATQTEFVNVITISSKAFDFPVKYYTIYKDGVKVKSVRGNRANIHGQPKHGSSNYVIVAVGENKQRAAIAVPFRS